MTSTQSVEDILRPLAEAKVVCPECKGRELREVIGQSSVGNVTSWSAWIGCPPQVPDPRFEALREREWGVRKGQPVSFATGGIDASLGAIVRAAAMCGEEVLKATYLAISKVVETARNPDGSINTMGKGATPEEAAARALVEAWGDEKAHSVTGAEEPNR